ncbi:hypothetical protein N7532_008297 [Penicillium argentinense]|uniref:Uncharacterized protein n=1 Tax=Penicillium argentinense TaxID=1131581 RepID=A0A9W9EX36_9EURO|nr:uncharacterized protein N7532_008297 [Penicillium argentinense]KAJ5089613.1 hypothetical protein N7532_008297 [Penicillium argentinense]
MRLYQRTNEQIRLSFENLVVRLNGVGEVGVPVEIAHGTVVDAVIAQAETASMKAASRKAKRKQRKKDKKTRDAADPDAADPEVAELGDDEPGAADLESQASRDKCVGSSRSKNARKKLRQRQRRRTLWQDSRLEMTSKGEELCGQSEEDTAITQPSHPSNEVTATADLGGGLTTTPPDHFTSLLFPTLKPSFSPQPPHETPSPHSLIILPPVSFSPQNSPGPAYLPIPAVEREAPMTPWTLEENPTEGDDSDTNQAEADVLPQHSFEEQTVFPNPVKTSSTSSADPQATNQSLGESILDIQSPPTASPALKKKKKKNKKGNTRGRKTEEMLQQATGSRERLLLGQSSSESTLSGGVTKRESRIREENSTPPPGTFTLTADPSMLVTTQGTTDKPTEATKIDSEKPTPEYDTACPSPATLTPPTDPRMPVTTEFSADKPTNTKIGLEEQEREHENTSSSSRTLTPTAGLRMPVTTGCSADEPTDTTISSKKQELESEATHSSISRGTLTPVAGLGMTAYVPTTATIAGLPQRAASAPPQLRIASSSIKRPGAVATTDSEGSELENDRWSDTFETPTVRYPVPDRGRMLVGTRSEPPTPPGTFLSPPPEESPLNTFSLNGPLSHVPIAAAMMQASRPLRLAGDISFIDLTRGLRCQLAGCEQRCNLYDGYTVICPGCGPFSPVRYCGGDHLRRDVLTHWRICGTSPFVHFCVSSSIPQRIHEGIPMLINRHGWNTVERHRQALWFSSAQAKGDYFLFDDRQIGCSMPSQCRTWGGDQATLPSWIIQFDDPEEKDRFRRCMAISLFAPDSNVEILQYAFRMIGDKLKASYRMETGMQGLLKKQFKRETGFIAPFDWVAYPHACEAEWTGKNPKGCPDPTCVVQQRLGHRTWTRTRCICLERKCAGMEASHWLLRASRTTHPTVHRAADRMRGNGFAGVNLPYRRVFRRGLGWDGAGTGPMELEGYNC